MTQVSKSKVFPMTWEESVQWLREQPDQHDLVRACYFDDPLLEAAERYYHDSEWQAIRNMMPAIVGYALDVGAGRGIASYALAKDGWQVTALEPNTSQLVGAGAIRALATESGLPINVVEEWGEKLPFADNSFDFIHARQVLHHARDLPAFCRELYRVLRPRGILIATREHVIDRPEDLPVFLQNHPLHCLYGGENAFTLIQYTDSLVTAGFNLHQIFSPFETPINYFPATKSEVRTMVGRRLFGPLWFEWIPIPQFFIVFLSRRMTNPGRLYTFVAGKR
ncbi:class I SAM-dependent methyltransferase [Sporomusa sphaeroides]|uniref:class I SAM-dependent methyltransferase n=1 Tax=Sporomusa sphaeroides TaxID=47679 RepID=UPI00315995C1